MNQSMPSPVATQQAAPTIPQTPDVVNRVEATLEQIDQLWADLDRGDFELMAGTESQPASVPRPSASGSKAASKAPSKAPVLRDYKVSIVIPVYNERGTILQVIEQLQQLPLTTEIIVVDDCSTDGTRGWLETLRGSPGLQLILKDKNEGKGAALRTGFGQASGDIVIVQDADLEYDPRDILDVIRPIVLGRADVSFGSRYLNGRGRDGSRLHHFGNWLLTALSNRVNGVRLTDMETCYKAFRRSVLREIDLKEQRFGFEPEITAKIARRQYRIEEVPVRYQPRGYAQGKKIGAMDLINTVYCILRYGWGD